MDKLERVQATAGSVMAYAVKFREKVIGVSKGIGSPLASLMAVEAESNSKEIGALLFDLGDALEQLGEEPIELAILVAEGDVEEVTPS